MITNEYTNANSIIYNNIINNLNMIQVGVNTNRSDYEIYTELQQDTKEFLTMIQPHMDLKERKIIKRDLSSEDDSRYIFNMTIRMLDNIKILKNEKKYQNIFNSVFDFRTKTNCENLYLLNDTLHSMVIRLSSSDNYTPSSISDNVSNICKKFNLFDENDITLLEESFVHMQINLLNKHRNTGGKYEALQILSNDYNFFDMYNIILLILRPYHAYINNLLLPVILNSNFDEFLKFMIIYLSLNIFVDFVIIAILYNCIIKKIQNSSRRIESFISIIKYM